ncbi:MAG: MFS transporter [Scandinavium sp.]|uniref:MFS transporter n=1 Tax=Scandinavium sp. TaxID=2830653 RepID=UPI003F3DBD6D
MSTDYQVSPIDKVSPRTLISYTLGAAGDNFIFIMIVTFLMMYYTDYVGLPAQTVGTLFLVTRIWDTASDLIWGVLIDNTHTRYGKFKPYLILGATVGSIALFATFSVPDISLQGKVIYAYITYFLLSTAYTCFDVPLFALATVVTKDPHQRNRLVFTTRTGAMTGQWIASLVTIPLLLIFDKNWSMVAGGYAFFFFATAMLTIVNVKENYIAENEERHAPSLYLWLIKHNHPLVVLMGFWICFNFVISARVGFGLYYFKYIFHSETAMATFLGISTFVTVLGALFATAFVRRLGKKKLCMGSAILLGASCCLLWFVTALPVSWAIALHCIPNFFLGILGVTLGGMLPDTIEYNEWRNGKRAEGMIFSLNMFQLKFSGAIGGALTGFILAWVGYVPNVEQTAMAAGGINLAFTLLPGALFIAMSFLLLRYELIESHCEKIVMELRTRAAE